MKIGIIGAYGRQAQHILSLINNKDDIELLLYEHKQKSLRSIVYEEYKNKTISYNLYDLLKCDGVIIASPNNTHYEYIEFFVKSNFSGYIFCEKPPVVSLAELLALNKISDNLKQKILFDFNLRFSKLYELLTCKKYGKLLYFNIVNGHGLGYKSSYKNSWRNDKKINKLGIFETVIIHYIDLLFNALGEINYDNAQLNINSPYGNTIDNCMYSARMKNEAMVNIFVSYTMPYVNETFLVFEDALIKLTNKNISIYSPRDTFASNGNFITPPLKENILLETNFWEDSEKRIINYFVESIKKNDTFPLDYFDKSMRSSEHILKKYQ